MNILPLNPQESKMLSLKDTLTNKTLTVLERLSFWKQRKINPISSKLCSKPNCRSPKWSKSIKLNLKRTDLWGRRQSNSKIKCKTITFLLSAFKKSLKRDKGRFRNSETITEWWKRPFRALPTFPRSTREFKRPQRTSTSMDRSISTTSTKFRLISKSKIWLPHRGKGICSN